MLAVKLSLSCGKTARKGQMKRESMREAFLFPWPLLITRLHVKSGDNETRQHQINTKRRNELRNSKTFAAEEEIGFETGS